MISAYAIPPFLAALAFLVVGLFTYWKSEAAAKLPFTLLCLLTVIWQSSWTVLFNVTDPTLALNIVKIGYCAIIFLPVVYYHFIAVFCGHQTSTVIVLYAIGGLFLVTHLSSNLLISGNFNFYWGYYPQAGPLHPVYLFIVFCAVFSGVLILRQFWKSTTDPRQRNQIKYVALSLILYSFAAIDFVVNYGVELYPPGFIFTLSALVLIAYAIAKYHILDINFVVKKTIYYSALLGMLLVPCFVIIVLAEIYSPPKLQIVIYSLLLFLVGFAFPHIKVKAERNLETLLFGGSVNYQETFERLSKKLVRLQNIDDLLADVVNTIAHSLDLDQLNIYLSDPVSGDFVSHASFGPYSNIGRIENNKIEFKEPGKFGKNDFVLKIHGIDSNHTDFDHTQVPIVFEKELIGFLLLGRSSFSRGEYSVLVAIANQLAIAINNSLQFEEIRLLNQSLEGKVKERTLELSSAYEELKHLSTLKNQFFSRVSHELRTPLANIIMPVQAALDDIGPKMSAENRLEKESILRNASILLKRINEILDIAKSEEKKLTIHVIHCDVSTIIQDVLLAASVSAKQVGIKIQLDAVKTGKIYVDPDKLERIFSNIVGNAIKFTPMGGDINILVEDIESEQWITIRDTGIGISKENLPHIFTAFHQIESAPGGVSHGTGLGLAICKEFMDLHHGRIEVISEIGQGSTFILKFLQGNDHFTPQELSNQDAWPNLERRSKERRLTSVVNYTYNSARESPEDSIEHRLENDGLEKDALDKNTGLHGASKTQKGKKILVVEDNIDLAQNMFNILSRKYQVITAANGLEGLEKVRSFQPDVIISDIMMPEMDGIAMLNQLKTDDATHHLPVILITAKTSVEDKIEGLDSGADHYLRKPFDPKELFAVVKSVLVKQEYQEKLLEKNRELERVHTELQEAIATAKDANKTKSKFLASMSHEFRTPLNAIIGYSEMLVEDADEYNLNNVTVQDLKSIHSSGTHLLSLINGVLDMAKIEAGRMRMYIEEYDILTMYADIESITLPLINKNSNKLTIEIPGNIGTMHADETKVRQILVNLISNAGKFTHHGTIDLRIDSTDINNNPWIIFKISDTGIGMTHDQMSSIFEEFSQADEFTQHKYGGTGLGLSISKHFCDMMGGNILVTSEVGKGSTFTVTLPRNVNEYKNQHHNLQHDLV